MKKLLLFAMVVTALGIFNACEKSDKLIDQSVDEQLQEVAKPEVYSENGYLAFKDFNAVDSIIKLLSQLTRQEIVDWEKSMNITSARSEYDKLFDEYEKLDSFEEFMEFKKRNREKLMFNEMDDEDCSIEYPYCTKYFLPVLNNKGLVKIGLSLIQYTKLDHIVIKNGDINLLKNPLEDIDNSNVFVYPRLKSTQENIIYNFPEDDPSGNNYKWHKMDGHSGRRLLNELRVDQCRYYEYNSEKNAYEWRIGNVIYLRQIGQKNGTFGWKYYTTTYNFSTPKIKVGNDPTAGFVSGKTSLAVKPSANVWLADKWIVYSDSQYTPPYIPVPTISFEMFTGFSGFGLENPYKIDYIVHSNFPDPTIGNTPYYFY